MPIVRMPDGANVSFPDDMPKEQIRDLIASRFPEAVPAPDPTQPVRLGGQIIPPPPPLQDMPSVGGTGAGRTLLEQGLQGATFNFADEITDRIGAGVASLATDENYDSLLAEARRNTKERFNAQKEQHPVAYYGGNIAGGLLTGAAGLQTKAGAAIANSASRGLLPNATGAIGRAANFATKIGQGAVSGAASGALYGAGEGEGAQRIENAREGAVLGAVVGGAAPVAISAVKGTYEGGKNLITGLAARNVDDLEKASLAMRNKSSVAYEAMRQSGATFSPRANAKVLTQINNKLSVDGILHPSLHGKTMGVVDSLGKEARAGGMTLERLDQWRRVLSDVPFNDPQDYRKARIAIEAIDDAVDNLGARDLARGDKEAFSALKYARKEWQRARKFETISEIIKKSDGDANYLKRELKKLADTPKKLRGFTLEEREALRNASRLSAGEGALKMLGKFGIDLGNSRIGNTALPVVSGVMTQSPALPLAGTAARVSQKAIARGKTETLLKLIEKDGSNIANTVGRGGAKRLLKAPPNTPAARILPKAALQNKAVFYDGKRLRTAEEVINILTEGGKNGVIAASE